MGNNRNFNPEKYIGWRHGILTCLGEGERIGVNKERSFRMQCDCGRTIDVRTNIKTRGSPRDCGCMHRHGRSYSRIYKVWTTMIQRCENPRDKNYFRYDGRGISVCEQWHSFKNFLADMGEQPKGISIDRIDNDGDYAPGNCRWATWSEQMRNTRQNVKISAFDEIKTSTEWSERTGINAQVITRRILQRWPSYVALTFSPNPKDGRLISRYCQSCI